MAGTIKRLAGPLALTNTYTTNVFNNATAAIISSIRQIDIANKTGSAATFRLYLGATGGNTAGTELFYDVTVPANSVYSKYYNPGLSMVSTDFLVGGASAATTLTVTVMGEQMVDF